MIHGRNLWVAIIGAGAMLAGIGATAQAGVIVSVLREAGPTQGTDSVSLYALGSDGDSTLVSARVTLQDLTQAGLVMGNYQITTGAVANRGFYTDITGTRADVAASSTALGASNSYSWVGNGQYNTTGFFTAVQTPDMDVSGLESPVSAGPYASAAANPFVGPLAAFHVDVGWTTPVDASAAGGTGNGKGALLAVAVVPHGDAVGMFGQIGGSATTVAYNLTDGAAVPEPASLGLLALGGVALLARRKRA